MLAYSDSGHMKRERENEIRVQLTKEILDDIDKLPSHLLKNQVCALFNFRCQWTIVALLHLSIALKNF